MTDGQMVGALLVLALVVLWVWAAAEFYLAPLRDEWADLSATVDQLRADIDEPPLFDAAAAVLAAQPMPEVEAHLREVAG